MKLWYLLFTLIAFTPINSYTSERIEKKIGAILERADQEHEKSRVTYLQLYLHGQKLYLSKIKTTHAEQVMLYSNFHTTHKMLEKEFRRLYFQRKQKIEQTLQAALNDDISLSFACRRLDSLNEDMFRFNQAAVYHEKKAHQSLSHLEVATREPISALA